MALNPTCRQVHRVNRGSWCSLPGGLRPSVAVSNRIPRTQRVCAFPPEAAPFNDAFKNALQEALQRQGPDALYSNPTSSYEETRISATEELLLAALGASRQNLNRFNSWAKDLNAAIEREEKQIERLEFVLEKCRGDAAFYKVLEMMNQ